MSTSTAISVPFRHVVAARMADVAELIKPRILALVLVTMTLSGYMATWGQPDIVGLLHVLIGTSLIAASASAMNQVLELKTDRLMPRTANRPLVAGRLGIKETTWISLLAAGLGVAYLISTSSIMTTGLAVATWVLYVGVYTPLKRHTWLNTAVGAVPGALPALIGWTGAGGTLGFRAGCLFLLVFLWQFPHFMAIAWLYRKDYRAGDLKMLTVVDPTGRRAGVQAVLSALSIVLVGLLPAAQLVDPSRVYLWASFLLGVGQLGCAVQFLIERRESTARRLLRASLIYLPIQLLLMTLLSVGMI